MCGIAIVISLSDSRIKDSDLKRMTDIISHRGPDGEGFFINEAGTLGFGHRRLSIIDLSTHASQPMKRGHLWLTYNGEIYNYIELKEELVDLGHEFYTDSDTEVVLAAFQEWGEDCVQRFNGMWAFAIYDQDNNTVFACRDRYGIKPLYSYQKDGFLYFCSEIKQLTTIEGWKARLNRPVAYDFLVYGATNHTNQTFFEGVFELRGGEAMRIDLVSKSQKKVKYYLPTINPLPAKPDSIPAKVKEFKELMEDAVRIALRSDVKVGSALSGGLDSSTIALVSSKLLHQQDKSDIQECVSACFEDKSVDESFFVDKVAEKSGIRVHKVFPQFKQFKTDFERLIWHQDEPFGTLSIFAQFCVFREAKENNITVMLDGQGADEILAGYDHFYRPYLNSQQKISKLKFLAEFVNYVKMNKKSSLALAKKKLLRKGNSIHFLKDTFVQNTESLIKLNVAKTVPEFSYDQLVNTGLHTLLRFEDRNSMAFSIESRVPFLDHRMVDFSLALGDNLKINKGVRKFILREAFRELLPREIYDRHDKYGFPTPQELWTRENLDYFTRQIHESEQILGNSWIDFDAIRAKIAQLGTMTKDQIFSVWRIIIFAKWVQIFEVNIEVESKSATAAASPAFEV